MQFFIDHSTYAALTVALIVMIGLLLYLVRVDGRLRRVERGLTTLEKTDSSH